MGTINIFFNSYRGRWNVNKIHSLDDPNGVTHHLHEDIARIAVDYFKNTLGQEEVVAEIPNDIELPCLNESLASSLSTPFSSEDVFRTIKKLAKGKSPGPDGFSVEFYLSTWHIVGPVVTKGILYFFESLKLPRIVNAAAICLVPKQNNPSEMKHFRPISCCNVLYKCISKILAGRLKRVLSSISSPCQSAFIPNRSIGDNVLLAQALCKDYHLEVGKPRCAIKLDIHKAFDSLNWSFIFNAMARMGFPQNYIAWVRICVTTTMFSVKINGSLEGFFEGRLGLRQGDPLSSYLFVLAMEILSACLKRSTAVTEFQYHWRCKDVKLHHIIFADDVFLFSHGDMGSVSALWTA